MRRGFIFGAAGGAGGTSRTGGTSRRGGTLGVSYQRGSYKSYKSHKSYSSRRSRQSDYSVGWVVEEWVPGRVNFSRWPESRVSS